MLKKSILPITVLITAIFAGCSIGTVDPEMFYGAWESIRETGSMNLVLSEESWVARYESGNNYAIDRLSWVPAINDDPATKSNYPKGYHINGTASKVHNISGLELGQQETYTIYLNKEKTAFLRKANDAPDYVFTKTDYFVNGTWVGSLGDIPFIVMIDDSGWTIEIPVQEYSDSGVYFRSGKTGTFWNEENSVEYGTASIVDMDTINLSFNSRTEFPGEYTLKRQ